MANLLPQQYVKSLKRERILRIVVVSLTALSFAALVTGALLLPSYFAARANERNAAGEIEVLQKILEKREQGDAASQARALRARLNSIQNYTGNRSSLEILDQVITPLPSDVSLVRIVVRAEEVQIDGVAGTRDGLLEYRRSLESIETFGSIPIDVSTLAQQFDVAFSLIIPLGGDAVQNTEGVASGEEGVRERPEIQGS